MSLAAVYPLSGQRILSAVLLQLLLSDSISSWLQILNGLERTKGRGEAEIFHVPNFDMAPVIQVGFHAICLR